MFRRVRLVGVALQMCAGPPDFDRGAFHERFNAEVTRSFFWTSLS